MISCRDFKVELCYLNPPVQYTYGNDDCEKDWCS